MTWVTRDMVSHVEFSAMEHHVIGTPDESFDELLEFEKEFFPNIPADFRRRSLTPRNFSIVEEMNTIETSPIHRAQPIDTSKLIETTKLYTQRYRKAYDGIVNTADELLATLTEGDRPQSETIEKENLCPPAESLTECTKELCSSIIEDDIDCSLFEGEDDELRSPPTTKEVRLVKSTSTVSLAGRLSISKPRVSDITPTPRILSPEVTMETLKITPRRSEAGPKPQEDRRVSFSAAQPTPDSKTPDTPTFVDISPSNFNKWHTAVAPGGRLYFYRSSGETQWNCPEALRTTVYGSEENEVNSVFEAALQDISSYIEQYISNGGDVNVVDDEGRSVMHYVCAGGALKSYSKLVSICPSLVNALDKHRSSCLAFCCRYGKKHLLRKLLKLSVDLSVVDSTNNNVFHEAATYGNQTCINEIFTYLMDTKQFKTINTLLWGKNSFEQTPWDCATNNKQQLTAECLFKLMSDERNRDDLSDEEEIERSQRATGLVFAVTPILSRIKASVLYIFGLTDKL